MTQSRAPSDPRETIRDYWNMEQPQGLALIQRPTPADLSALVSVMGNLRMMEQYMDRNAMNEREIIEQVQLIGSAGLLRVLVALDVLVSHVCSEGGDFLDMRANLSDLRYHLPINAGKADA